MLLTTPIINYVQRCVARAGQKPERILSEMQLCKKFAVSRVTVRRALKSLEENNFLIRLPGRQGAFTNPDIAMSIPNLVGIICDDGIKNYLSADTSEIFAGFVTALKRSDCAYEFLRLSNTDNKLIAREIENMSLDGLLWIAPGEDQIPAINFLIEDNFPIVTVASINDSEVPKPLSNTITRDFVQHAINYAQQMHKKNYRNIIRLGGYNITAKAFKNEMLQNGINIPDEFFIREIEEVSEKLPEFLNKYQIDAIIGTGGVQRYEKLLKVINSDEKWYKIPLYFESGFLCRKIKQKNPHLKIILHPSHYSRRELGKVAGLQMNKLLKENINHFESFIVEAKK